MMDCLVCRTALYADQTPDGALWRCAQCDGVAANLAVLSKYLEPETVPTFWQKLNSSHPGLRSCPSCRNPLRIFRVSLDEQCITLDSCHTCQLVWFDAGELEALPKNTATAKGLSPKIQRLYTLSKLQYEKELQGQITKDTSRLQSWAERGVSILHLLVRITLRV